MHYEFGGKAGTPPSAMIPGNAVMSAVVSSRRSADEGDVVTGQYRGEPQYRGQLRRRELLEGHAVSA